MIKSQLTGISRRQVMAFSVATLALAVTGCSVSETTGASATTGSAIEGTVDLFTTAAHKVSITWDETAYAAMIASYTSDSDKSWMSADITIDGTLIKNVGVRLKGNSTLKSLGGNQQSGGGGGGADTGGTRPTDMPTNGAGMDDGGTRPTDMPTNGGGGAGGMGGGGMGGTDSSSISSDDPTSLPLLIRFDKYVKGNQYQGMTELAIRPGTPVVNEALALSLTAATDQTTQRYSYTTYSVNGSKTQTRLLLENPDEEYADKIFDGNSVLFKADAGSSFTYQGEDQATYEDQFKQLNKTKSQDLVPIIKFLKWMDDADDATFESGLGTWVDVDALAKYTATMNLIVNTDDMAGPGNNYYLSYDTTTKKITIVSWDLNLSMTSNATAGKNESLSMGGGGGTGGGKGGKGGNALKTRFLASTVFTKLYNSVYKELYDQTYGNGTALTLLKTIANSIPASDALPAADIDTKVTALQTFVEERTKSLKAALAA